MLSSRHLLFFLIALITACSSGNIVIESIIVSGGDHGTKAYFANNTAYHVNYGDTVAFYKNKNDSRYHSIESNAIRIYLLNQEKSDMAQNKEPVAHSVLVIQKYIIEHSFWTGKQPATNISFEKKEITLKPFNYNIRFSNMGPGDINEIVFIDALPKEFRIKKLHYYCEDRSYLWASDFDDIVWETKTKNGIDFLIVRFQMKRRAMRPEEKFILRISGDLVL